MSDELPPAVPVSEAPAQRGKRKGNSDMPINRLRLPQQRALAAAIEAALGVFAAGYFSWNRAAAHINNTASLGFTVTAANVTTVSEAWGLSWPHRESPRPTAKTTTDDSALIKALFEAVYLLYQHHPGGPLSPPRDFCLAIVKLAADDPDLKYRLDDGQVE